MDQAKAIALGLQMVPNKRCTDEYVKSVLDFFADRIDNQIQTGLVSELMTRYVEVSRELEAKNSQLAQSDAGRREAQQIAMMGNWEFNIATNQMWWSDTMCRVLEVDETVASDLQLHFERVHPDDLATVMQIMDNFSNGIVPSELDYRLVMDNERIKRVRARFRILRDFNGKPIFVHGTIQDITETKTAEEKLKKYNDQLEELVQEKVEEAYSAQMATIYALVKLAESRDDDTGDHIGRTAEYCRLLAAMLWERGQYRKEIDAAFIENIANASPLHDIGKVGIPDAILIKPTTLTPQEFETMKSHTIIGYKTLASVDKRCKKNAFIKIGMEIALCHHERWDGSGYPNNLKGEQIPVSARIMALGDVYDALRSKRVYKKSYTHEKSVNIIAKGRGIHFDPLLVDLFLENNHAFENIFNHACSEE